MKKIGDGVNFMKTSLDYNKAKLMTTTRMLSGL